MARTQVADDDDFLAGMVRMRLSEAGHDVIACEDGQQPLDHMAMRRPAARRRDAILLDAMMPIRSGMDTLAARKADPDWREGPIGMLTARRNQRDVLAALKASAPDHAIKPYSPEDLALRIEGLLARQRFIEGECDKRQSLH